MYDKHSDADENRYFHPRSFGFWHGENEVHYWYIQSGVKKSTICYPLSYQPHYGWLVY